MDDALLMFELLSLPASALLAIICYPLTVRHLRAKPTWYGLALWLAGLVFLVGWVVAEYNSGVYADTHQTSGNVFDDIIWLLIAGMVSSLATITVVFDPKRMRYNKD